MLIATQPSRPQKCSSFKYEVKWCSLALSLAVAQPDQYQERTFVIAVSKKASRRQCKGSQTFRTNRTSSRYAWCHLWPDTPKHTVEVDTSRFWLWRNNWGYPWCRSWYGIGDYISEEHPLCYFRISIWLYVVIVSTGRKSKQPTLKSGQFIPVPTPKQRGVCGLWRHCWDRLLVTYKKRSSFGALWQQTLSDMPSICNVKHMSNFLELFCESSTSLLLYALWVLPQWLLKLALKLYFFSDSFGLFSNEWSWSLMKFSLPPTHFP